MKKFSQVKTTIKNKTANIFRTERPSQIEYLREDKTNKVTKSAVEKFFSKLFESREMAHVYHLQVRGDMGSHAKHLALGAYYEEVLETIDELVEIYQGQFHIIEGYDIIDTAPTKSVDPIKYFTELADFIKTERKCFDKEDTHYFNLIDDILVLIFKTLYKLKYNK
jgi:hypothetical protein